MTKFLLALALAAILTFSFATAALAGNGAAMEIHGDVMSQLSEDRLKSVNSIQKLTDYDDVNVYSMDIEYEYDLDHLTPVGVYDEQVLTALMIEEALPGVDVSYTAPDFACSSFTLKGNDGKVYFGRNYDFIYDSSAMIVRCHPKDGYASVAHAALDNLQANDPFASDSAKACCLASPFICLDGMNEKGVGISVLTLDSDPTVQNTGKPVLITGVLIRLVLDKAATTAEAVELISQYDICSSAGRDYHFYITDASGDGRVVEFDCNSETRQIIVSESRTVTNFFIPYKDQVLPNQKNGVYGHGRERYDAIEAVLDGRDGSNEEASAWDALKAAAQLPKENDTTSNTQWSVVYNLTERSYGIVLHRHWDDVLYYGLNK